jgi:hypothetical protein
MTLSRTARILIAVLLLAAAAFFWVNFFSQEPPAATPLTTTGTQPSPASSASSSTSTPAGAVATPTPASTPAGTTPQATAPAAQNAAPVVAPNKPAVATRDLQVAELPFLVTQPPASGQAAGSAAGAAAGSTSPTAGTQTTTSGQRMSVNPFSPIVVQAPAPAPSATQASAQPPASQQVTTAPAPSAQTATPPQLAEAPAPQPVAPPPPQASGLPHALPSGMLPTTPSVLQTTRAQASSSAPKDLGAVAAVRVPDNASSASLGTVSQQGVLSSAPTLPSVLGPGQPTQASSAQGTPANGNPPLQAGTDPLSRYLRDNNVQFTGTVLGPVSVGVFRSSQYKLPVVVSLGQVLPDTKITLTDLRGHEAVFTLNDSTQSLSLDLRR